MAKQELPAEKREIAERMRKIRERAGATQEQFAEMMGISVSALKKIESGENQVSVACLKRLNEGMNVSADWVLFDKTNDAEEVWESIENCSEEDKMFLMLRLLHYFTGVKKTAMVDKSEQGQVSDDIKRFLDSMKRHGGE